MKRNVTFKVQNEVLKVNFGEFAKSDDAKAKLAEIENLIDESGVFDI